MRRPIIKSNVMYNIVKTRDVASYTGFISLMSDDNSNISLKGWIVNILGLQTIEPLLQLFNSAIAAQKLPWTIHKWMGGCVPIKLYLQKQAMCLKALIS